MSDSPSGSLVADTSHASDVPEAAPAATWEPPSRLLAMLKISLGLAALVVALALPLYVSALWLRVAEYAMVGAVAAIGLTLLSGHCGQLSLGTPFFMLVGGTTYATLAAEVEADSRVVGLGLPPVIALVAAACVAALAGLAFAPVAGRVDGIYLALASLALVFVGLYLGQRFTEFTGGAATGRPAPPFTIFGFSLSSSQPELTVLGVPFGTQERMWYLFLALVLGSAFLALGAVRSRPGRAWRAVRDNPAAAAAMGVNVAWARASAFAVSSGYAGLAGAMMVLWFGILKADENEFEGTWSIATAISLLAMVIIGGYGSVVGAALGAAFVFGLPLALKLLVPSVPLLARITEGSGGFSPPVITAFAYGSLIVLVVIFEPGGLAAIGRRIAARFQRRPGAASARVSPPSTKETSS